ncbi:MAG: L,D-transpeptidase family protein [Pseudomonadota bacterium]
MGRKIKQDQRAKRLRRTKNAAAVFTVRRRPGSKTQSLLHAYGRVFPCAMGRTGVVLKKREGDGGTPRGRFELLSGLWRKPLPVQRTNRLPFQPITPKDGWCDAVGDRNYNRPVPLPYPASHERLWRADHLYDVVIVMDHNLRKRMSLGGSAIFFHLARSDDRTAEFQPTEGCIAVSPQTMALLLPRLKPGTSIVVL